MSGYRSALAVLLTLAISQSVFSQSTYSWTGASAGAWYTPGNWAGGLAGTYAGSSSAANPGTTTDVAVFNNAATSIGIDAGLGSTLELGALSLIGSSAMTIGNSSTTAGTNLTIVLNGAYGGNTGGSSGAALAANTLINVSGTANMVIANNAAGGTQNTSVRLGINNGIFNVVAGRTLTIDAAISDGGNNRGFAFQGGGTLVLTGNNTFAGGVAHNAGAINFTTGTAFGTGTLTIGSGVVSQAGFAGSPSTAFLNNTTNANTTVANNIVLPNPGSQTTYTIQKTGSGGQLNLTGNISGGGPNTKIFFQTSVSGDSTTTYRLAGNNTFQAVIELWRGGLIVASPTAFGSAATIVRMDSNNNTTLGDLRFEVGTTSANAFANAFELVSAGPWNTNANNVDISGPISGASEFTKLGSGTLTFSGSNTYTNTTTITAGSLQIGNGGTTGTPGTGNIVNNANFAVSRSNAISIDNVISGTGSVTQLGTGTTTLTAANTFTGALIINNGTLALGAAATLTTNAITVNSGGVYNVSAVAGYTVPATATLTVGRTGTAANDVIGDLTMAGTLNIGGTGNARTAQFANNLTLNAASVAIDFSNTTTIGGGVNDLINVGGNLTLTGTTAVAINRTAGVLGAGTYTLFQYTGTLSGTAANLNLTGVGGGTTRQSFGLNVGSGTNSAITLTVSGSPANLTWVGGTGGNIWDVVTTVNWTGATGGTPDNRFYNLDNVTFNASGVGGATPVVLNAAVAPGSVTVTGSQNYLISGTGDIGGTGGLTLNGPGTLTLATNNTYSGGTTISGGTLQIGNGGTVGGIAGAILNNAALTVNRSDAVTLAGVISGSGSLTQAGAGTTTLSGANTYAGKTFINNGTLVVASDANLGTAPGALVADQLSLANGTTLRAAGDLTIATNRGVTIAGTATFDTQANTLTVNSPVAGSGLTKIGPGTLALNAASSYSGGTTVSAGSVNYSSDTSFGTGTISFGANVTGVAGIAASPPAPFFNNTTAANTTLANAIVLPAPSADTTYTIQKTSAGGQINFTGVISGGSANVKLFLNASTGGDATTTYRFAAANTFTAPQIEIWRGGVVIGHMSGLGNPTNELIMDGNNNTALGDLRFEVGGTFPNPINLLAGGGGGINTNTNNVTFSGVMSGGNNLLKLGTGIMTMTATNTYTGTTTVAAGVLRINGDNSAATGAITVNAGASLGGTGTIGAPVAVTAGGTLAPGASIGTTTVANSVTVTGNAAPNQTLWDVELNGIAPNTLATADQTNVDRLVVTGAANNLNFVTSSTNRVRINLSQLGGTFTINGSPVFYRIATANAGSNLQSNGGTFDPTHFDFTTSGFTANSFSLAVDQNHLVISFVPVPEPGLLLGAGLLVLGTARVLRRNRRFRFAEQG